MLNDLKATQGINISYICCDNAGENEAFGMECKQEGMAIEFEYTAPGMPQQNGKVGHSLQCCTIK